MGFEKMLVIWIFLILASVQIFTKTLRIRLLNLLPVSNPKIQSIIIDSLSKVYV
jgi:hypothetical protein